MSAAFWIRRYVPDRPPTWLEVVTGPLIVCTVGPTFLEPAGLYWPAVLIGFLAFAIAIGPAANTTFGTRIGRWFRDIGPTGRLAVISGFAVAVAVSMASDAVPSAILADAASGGLVAALLFLIGHVLLAGEVSGWLTPQGGVD